MRLAIIISIRPCIKNDLIFSNINLAQWHVSYQVIHQDIGSEVVGGCGVDGERGDKISPFNITQKGNIWHVCYSMERKKKDISLLTKIVPNLFMIMFLF